MKNRIRKKNGINYILFLFTLISSLMIFFTYESAAQCGCIGGASVGSIGIGTSSSDAGILKKDFIRSILAYRYSSGDKYFNGDVKSDQGIINSFNNHLTLLNIGYGLTNDVTLEAEVTYSPHKEQDFGVYKLSGSGFSNFAVSGKYNFLRSILNEVEISGGAGVRVPFNQNNDLPQYISASSGAYSIFSNFFIFKGFKKSGLNLLLANHLEYSFENTNNFKYGTNISTAFFISQNIVEKLTGIFEVRNDIRLKDYYMDEIYEDSGYNILILSPHLNYIIEDVNINVNFDYPIYKYFNGKQLTYDYILGLTLQYSFKMD